VHGLPEFNDPNVLVGTENFSDAGVYRINDEVAIVQTVDFFPPLVEDPFLFGQIAAANALSDCYAMGAQPRTALNIVGFPDDRAPLSILQAILQGGAERVQAAGAVIIGGHSVRDAEIKYGLAVTGLVHPARILTNSCAQPGDVLVLTKALGTGFISTALRAQHCPQYAIQAAVASMIQLNDVASAAAIQCGASAATDITGFGLAGHALEMARASQVTLEISLGSLPRLPGAPELNRAGYRTRANATNRQYSEPFSRIEADASADELEFLYDPQTSGGLLVTLAADRAQDFIKACQRGVLPEAAVIIGQVQPKSDHFLIVTS
jgi:selenide, water dikinase